MAAPAPSSLFPRLADIWRHLSLRSDVDDIILELLGHFSLEKIYSGVGENDTYQHLVITLLAQLNVIFYIQRLTLPAENVQVGRYLGFLVSWEVTLRSVEFVLQVVAEGRESLWEARSLRDKYLAEFLLSALRILTLHPRPPANQRAKDRRDRLARVHRSLEQVFDGYPGSKSFLLDVCKEVTNHLHQDPHALDLPQRLRYELPNLTSKLYPLPECLLPPYISELVPQDVVPIGWLAQFLALRDVSQFVVGASVQYSVYQETRNVRLQSSSARSRNAILGALDNLRIPNHLSKMDLVATFNATFRIILPDTLDLSRRGSSGSPTDEYELDALEALSMRLSKRQIIHRVSDVEMAHSISQITNNILLQDDPSGQFMAARPRLYAMNCPECHFAGGSQLRSSGVKLPPDPVEGREISLPPQSRCVYCRKVITLAREVPLAKRAWELLRPLQPDADTINVERHLPTQFQLGPPKLEAGGPFNHGYGNVLGAGDQISHDTELYSSHQRKRLPAADPTSTDPTSTYPTSADPTSTYPTSAYPTSAYPSSQVLPSPPFPSPRHKPDPIGTEPLRSDSSTQVGKRVPDYAQETGYSQPGPAALMEPPTLSQDSPGFRRPSRALTESILSPTETAAPQTFGSPEKKKSRWKFGFSTSRKPSTGASGDSSSLSSTVVEDQKLEEISLGALSNAQKVAARGKTTKNINVHLSQNSTFALIWTQLLIQIWDVGTSPPTMTRSIQTASICILATITQRHLAYIIGTRDQKLTLRIMNLVQPSAPVVEYRIPSSLWCKSIAIDRQENYVVVGFENSIVRFFRIANTEQPREDRLCSLYHQECKGCPPVETLAFSDDGLTLLASTRSPKNGVVQIYLWQFPFLTFRELTSCRYRVPLHESEDNGISSAIFRSGRGDEENLICITTWTQSGTPVLFQPRDGHRSEIGTGPSGRHGKLGSRIQCAAFSPSGRELAMVNDKGYLYLISNLNSSPMDIRRKATSKELTAKSGSFSMAFMTLSNEENVVLAWVDSSKATAWIKKIPAASRINTNVPETPGLVYVTTSRPERNAELPGSPGRSAELSGEGIWPPRHAVELDSIEQTVASDNLHKIPSAPQLGYD